MGDFKRLRANAACEKVCGACKFCLNIVRTCGSAGGNLNRLGTIGVFVVEIVGGNIKYSIYRRIGHAAKGVVGNLQVAKTYIRLIDVIRKSQGHASNSIFPFVVLGSFIRKRKCCKICGITCGCMTIIGDGVKRIILINVRYDGAAGIGILLSILNGNLLFANGKFASFGQRIVIIVRNRESCNISTCLRGQFGAICAVGC